MNKALAMLLASIVAGSVWADVVQLTTQECRQSLKTSPWNATLDGRPCIPVEDMLEGANGTFPCWTFPDIDCQTSHEATLTCAFESPAAGELAFGASADWFFDADLDGRRIYTTGGDGNGSSEFGLWNHTVKAPVTAGPHELKITLRNGMAGMSFAMGLPQSRPVVALRPVTREEVRAACRTLWTTDCREPNDGRRSGAIDAFERAIARTDGGSFMSYLRTGRADFDAAPALEALDLAIDRVLRDIPRTTVPSDSVAIWYLYNMGIVVKTPGSTFGIDLSLPRDVEFAPLLDFLLVTHNHPDHVSERLVAAMQKKGGFLNGKPVISSFLYTRQFARTPQTFTLGDCRVETGITDHNPFWKESVTPFRITCGRGPNAPVLVHAGDGWDGRQLASFAPADIVFCHVKPFKGHNAAETSAVLKPKLTVILHAQEMSHGFGPQRASYALCASEAARVTTPGCQVVWPLWGETIQWPTKVTAVQTR